VPPHKSLSFFRAKYPTFVKFRKICVTKFNDFLRGKNYQNLKNLGNFVHKLKDVFGNKLPNFDFFLFFGFNCHHIFLYKVQEGNQKYISIFKIIFPFIFINNQIKIICIYLIQIKIYFLNLKTSNFP